MPPAVEQIETDTPAGLARRASHVVGWPVIDEDRLTVTHRAQSEAIFSALFLGFHGRGSLAWDLVMRAAIVKAGYEFAGVDHVANVTAALGALPW